jgi:hypothetical protein
MKPQRIRLSRAKGFNLQAYSLALNGLPAVNVSRPSRWGNPFKVYPFRSALDAVNMYRDYLTRGLFSVSLEIEKLRGKNLACWCHIWQCPRCGHYCDTPEEHEPECWCADEHGWVGGTTVMLRVPCHADILIELCQTK